MAQIELFPNEQILKQGPVQMGLKKGTGYLTNMRFALYARTNTMFFFGLIGELIAQIIMRPVLTAEFQLTSLTRIEQQKIGFNGNYFKCILNDGTEYLFAANYKQWMEAFPQALANQNLRLVPIDQKSWAVQA
jgi:hypothetical protein